MDGCLLLQGGSQGLLHSFQSRLNNSPYRHHLSAPSHRHTIVLSPIHSLLNSQPRDATSNISIPIAAYAEFVSSSPEILVDATFIVRRSSPDPPYRIRLIVAAYFLNSHRTPTRLSLHHFPPHLPRVFLSVLHLNSP